MKSLLLQLDSGKSKYLALSEALRNAIRDGSILCGETLPSSRTLADSLSMNRHTVMRAYDELISEGWLESITRSQYKVVDELPFLAPLSTQSNNQSVPFDFKINPRPKLTQSLNMQNIKINFAGGLPDIRLFPFEEYKSYMGFAINNAKYQDLGYSNRQGQPLLIEAFSTYLRRMRGVKDRELLVTNGSQEALYLISQVLLDKNSAVAIESLGYPPAWDAFASSGASLVTIKQDEHGLDPEDLAEKAKTYRIKALYLTPLHQYPSTVTLSVSRRMAIYQICRAHGIFIIEDDYDHEFHYRCHPLSPMAADDPDQRIIYLSTFSKILFPGARTGFMALPESLIDKFLDYRSIINHKPNTLMQDGLARWMIDGGLDKHIRKTTRLYQKRRDNAITQLKQVAKLCVPPPDGGMALWVNINQPAQTFAQHALSEGIYLQHENQFVTRPQDSIDRHVRIGFASMTEEEFSDGIQRLFSTHKTDYSALL